MTSIRLDDDTLRLRRGLIRTAAKLTGTIGRHIGRRRFGQAHEAALQLVALLKDLNEIDRLALLEPLDHRTK